jgi:hypothetical protein
MLSIQDLRRSVLKLTGAARSYIKLQEELVGDAIQFFRLGVGRNINSALGLCRRVTL